MTEPSSIQENAELKARIATLEDALTKCQQDLAEALQLCEYYRHQLFGKKSERYDPSQEHLDFGEAILGKPEPSAETNGGEPEEDDAAKSKSPTKGKRRTKDQLFPRNLKSIIVEERIPDEVLANPEAFRQIEVREHRELEVVRPEVYWRVTLTPKFVRKDDKQAAPVTSPAPRAHRPRHPLRPRPHQPDHLRQILRPPPALPPEPTLPPPPRHRAFARHHQPMDRSLRQPPSPHRPSHQRRTVRQRRPSD